MNRSNSMSLLSGLHARLVLSRRLKVLAGHALDLLPEEGTVLDVGCGNGVISRLLMNARPKLDIQGIDVLMRPECAIPAQSYDGRNFPYNDKSVDAVIFVDVLHHADDPHHLLREAVRVARRAIIVKDHLCDSAVAGRILALMDWVGNRSHGVAIPYSYWSSEQWADEWSKLGYQPDAWVTRLGLYPFLVRPVFERGLHFMARIPLIA